MDDVWQPQTTTRQESSPTTCFLW